MGAAGPNQMFRQGYRLRSIDRYQPWVCLTSPPYLVTLLHPTPLSLPTGMSNEDMRVDGRWNEDGERENKARSVISVLSPDLCCHLVKLGSYGVRGRDIIRVGGRVGSGVLRAGCVTEMTSSVNGMLSYKWLSADLRVDQPCVCVCVYTSIHLRIRTQQKDSCINSSIYCGLYKQKTHTPFKVCGKNSDRQ